QLRGLEGVDFRFPLVGADRSPLDFYSDSAGRLVYMPVLSLRFVEDLSTAYAWLWANRYSLATVDTYVAMLKYQKTGPSGRTFPPPLVALQIPADALRNPAVADLSLRFRNEAFAFVLAHELGHVLYRHQGYGPRVGRAQSRRNEEAADRFALEIMRLTSTIPVGALLYFQASAYYQPNRGDFASDLEWETFLEREATHPVTGARLRALASLIRDSADDLVRLERNRAGGIQIVQGIASRIVAIAATLEDTELQRYVAWKASKDRLESLHPRR
ncbi:MAG: hypothetical protein DMG07_16660, partial [Acidobacteria bacterium]